VTFRRGVTGGTQMWATARAARPSRARPRPPRVPRKYVEIRVAAPALLRITVTGYAGLLPRLTSSEFDDPELEAIRVALVRAIEGQLCRPMGFSPSRSRERAVERAREDAEVTAEQRAWILPLVTGVEMAKLAHRCQQFRAAVLRPEELERFSMVPSYREQAAEILKCVEGAPSFLSVELVALFITRHGFSTGGGPRIASCDTLVGRLAAPERLVAALADEPTLAPLVQKLKRSLLEVRPR
jgi:hypothetical protein